MGEVLDTIIKGSLNWYQSEFSSCVLALDDRKSLILDNAVDHLIENKIRYQRIERMTNVPWYLVGSLHYRESSFNFTTYLGNGDALSQETTHVPQGRGPFTTWESGAIDALEYDGLSNRSNWTIALCLMLAEKWNGLGYLKYHTNVLSPYVWSFTNMYVAGKYGSDGHFNPELVDAQAGVAAIFKEMQSRGVM